MHLQSRVEPLIAMAEGAQRPLPFNYDYWSFTMVLPTGQHYDMP